MTGFQAGTFPGATRTLACKPGMVEVGAVACGVVCTVSLACKPGMVEVGAVAWEQLLVVC